MGGEGAGWGLRRVQAVISRLVHTEWTEGLSSLNRAPAPVFSSARSQGLLSVARHGTAQKAAQRRRLAGTRTQHMP